MARWRLTSAHYLKVAGTEWHYNEVDRKSGKLVTRRFPVPTLLDPNEPSDWNHRYGDGEGEIIVAWKGKTDNERDIIFSDPPTPDMVPLDAEAKAETAKYLRQWNMPTDGRVPDSFGEVILNNIQTELQRVQEQAAKPTQVEGLTELLAAMATIMKQNAEIVAKLTAPQDAPSARRA